MKFELLLRYHGPARITTHPTGRLVWDALSQALRARLRSCSPSGTFRTLAVMNREVSNSTDFYPSPARFLQVFAGLQHHNRVRTFLSSNSSHSFNRANKLFARFGHDRENRQPVIRDRWKHPQFFKFDLGRRGIGWGRLPLRVRCAAAGQQKCR